MRRARAHLSDDLQQHLDAGDATATTVIVTGTPDQIAAIAARHGLGVRRLLTSGAVLEVPAGRLDELAADANVPQLSGDHVIRGQMAVTDVSIGADQAWASDFGPGGNGVTGKGVGVAILDSGVTIVPELKGQVSARVDMMDREGHRRGRVGPRDAPGGDHRRRPARSRATDRGVAPGAHLVSVKVLGADGSGHISDLIEGIDWVIANRQRYQINVINLSLGAPVEQSWRDDPVCQAIERAWRVNIVTVVAAGNFGKTADGTEVLGGVTSPGNCPYAITAGTREYEGDDVPQRRRDRDVQLAGADGDRPPAEAGPAGAGEQDSRACWRRAR